MDPKNRIVLPHTVGGKCVQCGGNQPCFMHTPLIFKTLSGGEIRYENVAHALGAVIASIAELEKKLAKIQVM